MLKCVNAVCGCLGALGVTASAAWAQDVTLTVQGPASASPGEVVTVDVVASVTGLPTGGAIGGYGLDLDVTSGASLVNRISGAASNPALGLGVLPGAANGSFLERAVGGQLPNIGGLNPGVDRSTTLSLFTVDLTIDPAAADGVVEVSAGTAAGAGGVVLFPDASAGTNIIAPSSAGTSLTVVPLRITIGEVACPGDTDGNNVVNVNDLLTVIAALGATTPGGPAAGDVNGDTFVNITDLLDVLSRLEVICS